MGSGKVTVGTSYALNYSIDHLTNAVSNHKHIIGIFVDLSKAFDTIDHNILLNKLDNYGHGVRGAAHNLISSYLTSLTVGLATLEALRLRLIRTV